MEKKKAADAQLIIKFLITSFLLVLIAGWIYVLDTNCAMKKHFSKRVIINHTW
jgi:hypothetical protein